MHELHRRPIRGSRRGGGGELGIGIAQSQLWDVVYSIDVIQCYTKAGIQLPKGRLRLCTRCQEGV
jgi:hypothetical protein